jgi:glycosyltransferase involved in cell wall biosynthesis
MSGPRVSIICPIYNRIRFLGEAIESVLRQDFRDYELLLVDDGSTDGSAELARSYESQYPNRIRCLEHPGHINRGMSPSRNLALHASRGELVSFIDSDDVWRPNKLREQVAIIDHNPSIGLVCGTVNYWSSWCGGKDRLVATGHMQDSPSEPIDTLLQVYPLGDAHAPCPSDVLFRREIVGEEPFEQQFAGPAQLYEDQPFFVKAYLAAPTFFSSRIWLDYRQHADSCVSVVVGQGLYKTVRAQFLEWMGQYVHSLDIAEKNRILARIAQAQHDLEHPNAARLRRLGRRARSAVPRAIHRN